MSNLTIKESNVSRRYFQIGLSSVLMTVLFGVQVVQAESQENADPAGTTEAMEETKSMTEGADPAGVKETMEETKSKMESAKPASASETMEETKSKMEGAGEAATKSDSEAGETEESEGVIEKVKSFFTKEKEWSKSLSRSEDGAIAPFFNWTGCSRSQLNLGLILLRKYRIRTDSPILFRWIAKVRCLKPFFSRS